MDTYLPLGHEIGCDGQVLVEDGQVQAAVALSVGDGRIRPVSQQLDHHGEVALPGDKRRWLGDRTLKENSGVKWIWDMFSVITSWNVKS